MSYICKLGDFGLKTLVVGFKFFFEFIECIAFASEEIQLLLEDLDLGILLCERGNTVFSF